MNKEITLTFHIEEINSIMNVLGELPSKSGAWPLMMKIQQQAEPQLPKPANEEAAEAA